MTFVGQQVTLKRFSQAFLWLHLKRRGCPFRLDFCTPRFVMIVIAEKQSFVRGSTRLPVGKEIKLDRGNQRLLRPRKSLETSVQDVAASKVEER